MWQMHLKLVAQALDYLVQTRSVLKTARVSHK